jgi:DNA-binding MarR family transcriptional regulator
MMENTLSIGLLMISNSLSDTSELAMLRRWRKEYDTFYARVRQTKQVLAAIGEGYDTVSEIVHFTGINITTVRRIINRLVSSKKIRQCRVRRVKNGHTLKFEIV